MCIRDRPKRQAPPTQDPAPSPWNRSPRGDRRATKSRVRRRDRRRRRRSRGSRSKNIRRRRGIGKTTLELPPKGSPTIMIRLNLRKLARPLRNAPRRKPPRTALEDLGHAMHGRNQILRRLLARQGMLRVTNNGLLDCRRSIPQSSLGAKIEAATIRETRQIVLDVDLIKTTAKTDTTHTHTHTHAHGDLKLGGARTRSPTNLLEMRSSHGENRSRERESGEATWN